MNQNYEFEDPIDEATKTLRKAVLIPAAATAERLARQLREMKRTQADNEQARAERMAEQYGALRHVATATRDQTTREWFDQATPADVAQRWQDLRPWADAEPEHFRHRTEDLRSWIQDRFDVDMANVDELRHEADPENAHADQAEERRQEAADQDLATVIGAGSIGDAAEDHAESETHRANADELNDRADHLQHAAETRYDTDERRAAMFERATQGGADAGTAAERVRASEGNSKSLRDSLNRGSKKRTQNKRAPARSRSAARSLER